MHHVLGLKILFEVQRKKCWQSDLQKGEMHCYCACEALIISRVS